MSDAQSIIVKRADSGHRLLSAWLNDPKFQKAWKPESDLFAMADQQAIARVMATLEPPVDTDQLMLQLHRHGVTKQLHLGADEVNAILYAPAVLDPWAELNRLRELKSLATLRDGLRKALIAIEMEGAGLDEARGSVSQALTDSMVSVRGDAFTVRELLWDAYQAALQPPDAGVMTTGVADIDARTGGIRKGDSYIFGAETNWGKTAYCVLLWHLGLTRSGIRPGIVSFEDSPNLYARRLLAMRANISAIRLRDHNLRRWEQDKANDFASRGEELKCFIDARGRPIESVTADMRSLAASEGINFWLVDYLQAMEAKKDFGTDRRQHVNYCARQVINTFEQTGGCGFLFSQVTKDATKKKIDKDSLRETRDLAMMATVVMLGQIEIIKKQVGMEMLDFEQRQIYVDKVKDGPSKYTADIEWNGLFAGFVPDLSTTQKQEALGLEPDDYEE